MEKRTISGVCTPGARRKSAQVRWEMSWVTYCKGGGAGRGGAGRGGAGVGAGKVGGRLNARKPSCKRVLDTLAAAGFP